MRKLYLSGFLTVIVFFSIMVQQNLAQNIGSADVQFELQAYDLAIESYLAVIEQEPHNEHAMLRLAESYERINDLINSVRWYDKLFTESEQKTDQVKIAYGKILKSLGLYEQAKSMFASCQEGESKIMAEQLALGCDFASEKMHNEDDFHVFLFRPSTEMADFAPAIWKDKLIYCSYENDKSGKSNDFSLIHSTASMLMISDADRKTSASDVTELTSELFNADGISSCSYSAKGDKVLFTRNNFRNNNKQIVGNEKNLSVYMASVSENGDFYNEYSLPFNNTDYAVGFACFGENDNNIYFASNMTGNRDNFDIYESNFDGKKWSDAKRLSDAINSQGNEICPSFENGNLYFSSDLHPGLGGYDIFSTNKMSSGWSSPKNVGKGINSIADDLYLIKNNKTGEFYYTSNRLGGKGNYDIYVSTPLNNVESDFSGMLAEASENIPKAVLLESMEDGFAHDVPVSSSSAVENPEYKMAPNDLSLDGAVRVSTGKVINATSKVYFVQLASLSNSKGSTNQYKALVEYGNVYRVKKNTSYKIRLGYFHEESEAKNILNKIRREGYKDVFLVEDQLNIRDLELIISSFTFQNNDQFESDSESSEYKVRLAAYSNPLYFDTEKVKDIGVIEQWSKGQWTIFLLGGYKNITEAQQARIKAINRGFTGAELVIDQNGILSRLKEN